GDDRVVRLVEVVLQHSGGRHRQVGVLIGRVLVVAGLGWGGHAGDVDGHPGRGRLHVPVEGDVGEVVLVAEVRATGVGERAVVVERQFPAGGLGPQPGGERVAVGVGVVGQHALGPVGDPQGGVLGDRVGIGVGGRAAVVDRDHRDAHVGHPDGVGGPVRRPVAEVVGAVVVLVRGVGERTVGPEVDLAVVRTGVLARLLRHGDRVAVGVAVVGQHVGVERGVLLGVVEVVDHHRRVVEGVVAHVDVAVVARPLEGHRVVTAGVGGQSRVLLCAARAGVHGEGSGGRLEADGEVPPTGLHTRGVDRAVAVPGDADEV